MEDRLVPHLTGPFPGASTQICLLQLCVDHRVYFFLSFRRAFARSAPQSIETTEVVFSTPQRSLVCECLTVMQGEDLTL